jgi:hypothetical protein
VFIVARTIGPAPQQQTTPVPEPATMGLVLLAGAGLTLAGRRRVR